MVSNQYTRTTFDESSLSNQDIKLSPSTFYTPSPFSSNLQNQYQQHPQQYSQEPPYPTSSFNGSLIPATPPLIQDMENYRFDMSSYGYSNTSYQVSCYPSPDTPYGHPSQAIPRSMEGYNLRDYYLSSHPSHPSSYQQSPSPVAGYCIEDTYSRRASISRSTPLSPRDIGSLKLEEGVEDLLDGVDADAEIKVEEPYAKLIHRALMQAPNYSMSLQDIYKWFIDNTDKGSSATSGWRNSIRHNLSMNAAFRKSDRIPTSPSGEAPKKSSEWVLEPWAVKDGVTPTTRYRKTNSKKSALSRNPSTINSSRQSAGKKGGNMAGRTKALRMQAAHRDGRDSAPPRDFGMDRMERLSGMVRHGGESGMERELSHYRDQTRKRNYDAFRTNSPPLEDPMTPASIGAGPYYGHQGAHSYYGDELPEPQYHLSQVQGVHPEYLASQELFVDGSYAKEQGLAGYHAGWPQGSYLTTE